MKKLELAFKFVENHFSFVSKLFPWGIPNTNIDGLSTDHLKNCLFRIE